MTIQEYLTKRHNELKEIYKDPDSSLAMKQKAVALAVELTDIEIAIAKKEIEL